MAYLKDQWTAKQDRRSPARIKREGSQPPFQDDPGPSDEDLSLAQGFRVGLISSPAATVLHSTGVSCSLTSCRQTIKTTVADNIRQLIISPNSDYLAILTSHTVHVCVLPDPSHLTSEDSGPLKPKIWTLGPTTHVTSRSPVATALWHPLGVKGSCLVTVTTDAIVRLWELSLKNRWSFDTPTLSIDLKKLADGTTLDQDFAASTMSTNTNFSPDVFEMEVASACFAERESGGWSPMTLWVAMTEGDVYALCPLLPQRWSPPPALIPSLSVSIVANVAAIEDDPDVSERERLLAHQQLEWMGEIDSQEPQMIDAGFGEPAVEVYSRPSKPGAIPRLQGPFELIADPEGDDLDSSLTDIRVIGQTIAAEELMMGEEEDLELDESERDGLSLSVICLLSSSGQLRVLLDLEGIEAQWLPPKSKSKLGRLMQEAEPASLLTFQSIDTMGHSEVAEGSWPMFSRDVMSRYAFFVSHHAGITYVSLTPWVFRLQGELQGASEVGSDFRLRLLSKGRNSTRERLFTQPSADVSVPLAASVAIRDSDLGYFLLSGTPYEPIALTFDMPEEDDFPLDRDETPVPAEKVSDMQPLDFYEPRPAFQPPHAFDQQSALPELHGRLKSSRHRALLGQQIRLSPVTLQIFTDAHRVLGEETYKLATAVAELFRRCTSLQHDLREQIQKANEVKEKIDRIAGHDRDGEGDGEEEEESDEVRFARRITRAQERQQELAERLEGLRRHASKSATRELSGKERALVAEVRSMEASLSGETAPGETPLKPQHQLSRRLEEVERLRDELVAEIEWIQKKEGPDGQAAKEEGGSASPGGGGRTSGEFRVPAEIRKAKMQQVMNLLARETALVEAVSARLERLQM